MVDSTINSPQVAAKLNAWYEVVGFGIAVIDATYLVLIFQALNQVAAGIPTTPIFLYFALVFLIAYQLLRFFQKTRLTQSVARALLFLTYVLLTWLGIRLLIPANADVGFDPFTTSLRGMQEVTQLIPAHIWLIPFLLFLFLRGTTAARQGVGTFAVRRHFRFGVFMFLLYSGLAFGAGRDLPGLGMFTLFMFASLLSMASARVAILGRLRGGRRNPFSRAWFGSMTGAVMATIAVGFSAAMLATGRFLLFYRQVVVGLFFAAVTITVSPFIAILGLFADTSIEAAPAPPPTPELPPWEDDPGYSLNLTQQSAEQVDIIPPEYRVYFYWGLSAVAVLIVIGLFFGVRTMTQRREPVELTEYIVQRGDLLSRLRKELEKRRNELQATFSGANPLARGQQILAAARIRRIYAALIELAATFGSPRDPAQTPLEFLSVLQKSLPAAQGELQTVTNAYLKIRYGELPEHAEEVQAVENAWTQIRQVSVTAVKDYEMQMKEAEKQRKRMEAIQ